MPRAEGVQLYFGLGAYRIGDGDGSSAPSEEWNSGRNLADMAAALAQNGYGYSSVSYTHLLSICSTNWNLYFFLQINHIYQLSTCFIY